MGVIDLLDEGVDSPVLVDELRELLPPPLLGDDWSDARWCCPRPAPARIRPLARPLDPAAIASVVAGRFRVVAREECVVGRPFFCPLVGLLALVAAVDDARFERLIILSHWIGIKHRKHRLYPPRIKVAMPGSV